MQGRSLRSSSPNPSANPLQALKGYRSIRALSGFDNTFAHDMVHVLANRCSLPDSFLSLRLARFVPLR
jgi:hypothetical protein